MMHGIRKHAVIIALLSIVIVASYGALILVASEETAKTVGIGYVVVLTSLIFAWDLAHRGR